MMKNWCPGNPENTGHEPLHEHVKNRETGKSEGYTFMGYEPGEDDGPPVDVHICRHCSLVYATPAEAKAVDDDEASEVAAE